MASIEAAKAKAAAEKAYRAMVIHNNKTCNLCNVGKEKIAKRRLEIEGTIKQEIRKKAARMAERKRQHEMHYGIDKEVMKQSDIYYGKKTRKAAKKEEKKELAKPAPQPAKLAEPAKQAQPAKPAEPAKPAQPAKPAEPAKPAQPAKPAEQPKAKA